MIKSVVLENVTLEKQLEVWKNMEWIKHSTQNIQLC